MTSGIGFASDSDTTEAEDIDYGTHTLPKKFWTSGRLSSLKDPDFKSRRREKHERHIRNHAARAEANRVRSNSK